MLLAEIIAFGSLIIIVAASVSELLPGAAIFASSPTSTPVLSLSPANGVPGSTVKASGTGFGHTLVQLSWDGADTGMPAVQANGNGSFTTSFHVATTVTLGTQVVRGSSSSRQLSAQSAGGNGGPRGGSASAEYLVQLVTVTTPAPTPIPSPTASPTTSPTPTPLPISLTLTLESHSAGYYSPYPLCLGEDDAHGRQWSGSIAAGASFSTSETLCTFQQRGGGPGGQGLSIRASGQTNLSLTATAPSGIVYSAHDLGASRGLAVYSRCFVSPQLFVNTIEPGKWIITVSNRGDRVNRDVSLAVVAGQADPRLAAGELPKRRPELPVGDDLAHYEPVPSNARS